MTMPLADINLRESESFPSAQIVPFIHPRQSENTQVLENSSISSEVLDKHFALQNGSHKDVEQYVVYFCHIMAFFKDGSHCGLANTKQFVAFSGNKDKPSSLVLKAGSSHIEVSLDNGAEGVQLNTPKQEMFTSRSGEDYFVE
jgi:malate synthase